MLLKIYASVRIAAGLDRPAVFADFDAQKPSCVSWTCCSFQDQSMRPLRIQGILSSAAHKESQFIANYSKLCLGDSVLNVPTIARI